jgi:hypothetical protein
VITYEVNVSWLQPHPRLPNLPDGSLPYVPFARRPNRRGTRMEALAAADAAIVAVRAEHYDAHAIESTVHLIRFDQTGDTARIVGRQHIATCTSEGRIEHDVKDDQDRHQ